MDEEGSLHIVVFPWLAFGHMIPLLELSKSLARRGHHISFLSTPRNIQRLPKVSPQLAHLIDFISLPLPPVEGLPENAEATSDLPHEKIEYLKKALDGLAGPFAEFIKEASPKPDWIIQDFAQPWIPPIASEIGVPCIFFSGFFASCLVFFGSWTDMGGSGSRNRAEQFTVPPEWITFPTKLVYRLHEAQTLFFLYANNASGLSDANRCRLTIEHCKAVAPRSCREIESDWLNKLHELYKKPIIPVGLLPAIERDENDGSEGKQIMEWLDEQNRNSVVYVAFGSEAPLSIELIHEVALGLELSKLPFLWALRRPAGVSDEVEILPKGFEDRTRGYGFITGWVPQVKVLAHGSVGGFLTHCGCSSIIEGLQFGHPLVLLPIFGDQGLNARMMEEKGFGVEVERNEEDGSFTGEAVAKAVRLVMVEEEGEGCRSKAREMGQALVDKGCQEQYVDEFIQFLRSNRN